MRALSFLQPWLHAVLRLGKNVENRTWQPPQAMIGQVFALHASKGWDKHGEAFIRDRWPEEFGAFPDRILTRGAIVGLARLRGWARVEGDDLDLFDHGVAKLIGSKGTDHQAIIKSPWFFGPYGWLLDDVFKLEQSVPCKGALGFWDMPQDVETEVALQLLEPGWQNGAELVVMSAEIKQDGRIIVHPLVKRPVV